MARRKKVSSEEIPPIKKATTPEGREQQLIAEAYDLAEQRMLAGTASSAEVVHFLKLGSSLNKLQSQKLEHETELLNAKTQAITNLDAVKTMMDNAMSAFKSYSGDIDGSEEEDDDF